MGLGGSKLTFLKFNHKNDRRQKFNLYQCSCGNQKIIAEHSVKAGTTRSCGCFAKELSIIRGRKLCKTLASRTLTTHGKTHSKVYRIYAGIKSRCYNTKDNKNYSKYGARGIIMSDEWKKSFDSFYMDMGDPPTNKHSIDRIDNNGNYCKENCRWATIHEQSVNKRNTVYVEYNMEICPLATLIREMSLDDNFIRHAIKRKNMTFEQSLLAHNNKYGR